jgi:hypothetical protein
MEDWKRTSGDIGSSGGLSGIFYVVPDQVITSPAAQTELPTIYCVIGLRIL